MFMLSCVEDLLVIGEESEVNGFIASISKVFNLKQTAHLNNGTWICFLAEDLEKCMDATSAPRVKSPTLPCSSDETLHKSQEIQNCNWQVAVDGSTVRPECPAGSVTHRTQISTCKPRQCNAQSQTICRDL
eukprot:2395299-Amphidinium_carterae.1